MHVVAGLRLLASRPRSGREAELGGGESRVLNIDLKGMQGKGGARPMADGLNRQSSEFSKHRLLK